MAAITHIDGRPFDSHGNPLVPVGCPNCGKGRGHMDYIGYAAALNSGREPAGPCSRRCELQFEHASKLGVVAPRPNTRGGG